MPLYDFKCPHGHMFEHMCKMAESEKSIPCEGEVNRLADHELDDETYTAHEANRDLTLPDGLFWVPAIEGEEDGHHLLVRKVPCQLQAKVHTGTHNNPRASLDHGSAANRDAAREGRYDPHNPNTRFMSKGRSWRK